MKFGISSCRLAFTWFSCKHKHVSGKGVRSDTMILTGAPLAPQGGVHQVLLETKALWGRGVGLWICCFTIQNHSALIYCLPCLDTRCRPRTSVKMGGKQKRRSFCLVIAGGMVLGSLSSHVSFNLFGFLYPNSVEFQFPRVIQDFWGPEWYSIQSGSCRLECCDPIQCKEAAKAFSRVYWCDVVSHLTASFSHQWMSCKDSVAGLQNAVRFHLVLDCRWMDAVVLFGKRSRSSTNSKVDVEANACNVLFTGCGWISWIEQPAWPGHTKEQCCYPRLCTAEVCKSSDVKAKSMIFLHHDTRLPAFCHR